MNTKTSLVSAVTPKAKNKKIRGFSLLEIIIGVVLLGIFAAIAAPYAKNLIGLGTTNSIAQNVNSLNQCVAQLNSAGATFSTGTTAVTAGSNTSGAAIVYASTAAAADVSTLITNLQSGIKSYGTTVTLTSGLTPASYTYTNSGGVPVFSAAAGATTP